MERHKKERRRRKKVPRVPIKTYRWEDIRRARLRGGYPWTYLYKEPFKEKIDSKLFQMETKSKSSSSLQKSSPRLTIREITNGTEETDNHQNDLIPEPSGYIIITEVPSDSENHSREAPEGSVTIEDVGESEIVNIESAESSDNISQYLDKEEPVVEPAQTSRNEEPKTENGGQERAKSEEPKRKRKLSIDSSYSRKSLSKLAIMKKLKDAKAKIKVPKLNIPSLPNLSVLSNPLKQEKPGKNKKEPQPKSTPTKESERHLQPNPKAKPVYIHIPLKPPEGQTDEFSYLEFGEKKPEEPEKEEEVQVQEPLEIQKPMDDMPTIEISEAFDEQRRFSENSDEIVAFAILKSETIDLDHAAKNGLQGDNDYLIIQQEDDAKSETRSMIIIMPGSDEVSLSRSDSRKQTPSRQGSKKVRAKSAEPEKKRKLSADSGYSRRSLSKLGIIKKLKEARDKIKIPTFSFSRSDSKKAASEKVKEESSLPKETKTEVKKTNEPKYIHIPLKPPPGQSDEYSYLEHEEKKEEENKTAAETSPKEQEQSSIESPGSPKTEGKEGVQFIFLTPPSDDEVLDGPDIPETPSSENKNFFAPIDELQEIARDAVDSASPKSRKKLQPVTEEENSDAAKSETEPEVEPTKDNTKEDKPEESTVESKKETLETPKSKKGKTKGAKKGKPKPPTEPKKAEDEETKAEKMVVDEEDGLKLTESAMAKQEQNIKSKEVVDGSQELKSSLKIEGSPILKKKVSFKRRSRDDSKDGDYEDIQAPANETAVQKDKATDEHKSKLAVMGTSQSMSVDEEKSYLDEQKIIKSTSLEEDYNRWSKLSDHEYEPVNPPPDNVSPLSAAASTAAQPPTVHVIDTDRGLQEKSLASSTTSLERRMLGAETEPTPDDSFTVQEMQTEIENKYFSTSTEPKPSQAQSDPTPTTVTTSETKSQQPKSEGPGKFQQAFKIQADKFRTKLHEMKKPNIKLPSKSHITKPNLQKFKFEKPKFNLPKMPDTTKINLPTFSLPRKNPLKRSLKQRQLSTESNAGGSKKNYFDFRTYPRLFKKKPKDDFDSFSSKSEREVPEFATVPRTKRNKDDDRWGGRDTIRVPLHPEDSIESEEREDSVERRMASHMRYDQDIDTDDAYEKENQEIHTASPFSHDYNSRWNHGSFHPEPNREFEENDRSRQVTDLDSPEDGPAPNESFDTNTSKDIHSSESSLGIHRRGVLEEIDSDEFFLRQKGISQDNIEVGMYLSSEIREAFKSPSNALADLQRQPRDFSYDPRASNQSLPETPPKRKAIKKPKRKKTPHVSQEQISFDQDSELDNEIPPSRPKRRSKRNKKQKYPDNIIPYQETIAVDVPDVTVGVLQSHDDHERLMYENEQMQGREQPEIRINDPYIIEYDSEEEVFRDEEEVFKDEQTKPSAPPRKQRSLKSLNYSEHDSILGDFNPDMEPTAEDVEVYKTEHEYIIPTPEIPPVKPKRTLSRSSSKSRDNEEILKEIEETPLRPTRTRSRSRTRSRAESLTIEEPCIEEICVEDFRDSMGYAVIDKHTKREPPLPPPRTPPRRKRSVQSSNISSEQRFSTVPRSPNAETPIRPLRNYSTLGPSRPPRKKQPVNMTDEEKENIDITQYIEIEDEPNRDLHSGEVIQKMRDRPLPAPPRPPRTRSRTLHDITSEENLMAYAEETEEGEDKSQVIEEAEVSTQTEPLPDDFVNEERIEEEKVEEEEEQFEPVTTETHLITPTHYTYEQETITHGSLIVAPLDGAKILPDSEFTRIEKPRGRIVPVERDYDDETSEIPEEFTKLRDPEPTRPEEFAKLRDPEPTRPEFAKLRDPEPTRPEFAKLRDPEPTRSEEFAKLRDPEPTSPSLGSERITESSVAPVQALQPQSSVIERIIERPVVIQPDSSSEVEVLKAQKLQVSDLDVDRLSVNELLASRIVVSEIESGNIQANEISSKSGALKIGEIELPPSLIQQLFEKLQSVAQEQQSSAVREAGPATTQPNEEPGQKKTPIEQIEVEALPPQRPPRKTEEIVEISVSPVENIIDELLNLEIERNQTDSLNPSETEEIIPERPEPPEPPVRTDSSIKPTEAETETEETVEEVPQRPPRHVEKAKADESSVNEEQKSESDLEADEDPRPVPESMVEPEIDDEPPPRPPEPQVDYVPSQPPASFYALRAQQYIDGLEGDIPMAPRRRRHHKPPISRSSSDESPAPPPSRRRYRSPEPTIPQLTGQLIQACGSAANSSIKRLIAHITNNVLRNADGQQDLHVMMVILLVLIAGLILLGFGDGKTVHYHHWEFFNPPRDT